MADFKMNVRGVPGTMHAIPSARPGLWIKQRWTSESRVVPGEGSAKYPQSLRVDIRLDDVCNNGHNSFAITATQTSRAPDYRRDGGFVAGGCMHDTIAKVFPELAPLIKWHLTDTTGPMHYPSNAVYHAGNRDSWGKLAGEPKQWSTVVQFGNNPIQHKLKCDAFAKFLQDYRAGVAGEFDFEVIAMPYEGKNDYKFGPKYTYGGYGTKWYNSPFESEGEALRFLKALQTCEPKFLKVATSWGEGKARDLDAARSCAVWPEATDEELCAPDLADKLKARLPALLAAFRADMDAAGFKWEPVSEGVVMKTKRDLVIGWHGWVLHIPAGTRVVTSPETIGNVADDYAVGARPEWLQNPEQREIASQPRSMFRFDAKHRWAWVPRDECVEHDRAAVEAIHGGHGS